MLSRVAEKLFWIGRYVERAENIARLVDAARRMSALPRATGQKLSNEWSSILIAGGATAQLGDAVGTAGAVDAARFLMIDPRNPSSVRSCLVTARENARAVRFAFTQECWEALNATWSRVREIGDEHMTGGRLSDTIDWVKSQSALFRGAVQGTMVRDDGFDFLQMGAAIERVDSTARILDVKYHVLLPSLEDIGSSADHYQWSSLLQAAAAQRAYAFVTKSDVSARGVAQFLILEARFPRAILFNIQRLQQTLASTEDFYGQKSSCHDHIGRFVSDIAATSIEDIFDSGLHEFLTDVIERNYTAAETIAQAYGFAPAATEYGQSQNVTGQ